MIPPCVPIPNAYELGPVALFTTSTCDPWFILHIFNVFMMTIWTRRWYFGFLMAGVGELIEYFSLWAFKSFIIFLGTHPGRDFNTEVENFAGSYLDDWLFAGGIGTILGWIFYLMFTYPALLRYEDIMKRPLYTIYYFFWLFVVSIIVPSAFFRTTFGSFQFGLNLPIVIYAITILILIWTQPKDMWEGYSTRNKWEFYGGWILLSMAYMIQNNFDWFFSTAMQALLVTGIILIVLVPWSLYRWDWFRRIRLSFDFKWNKQA